MISSKNKMSRKLLDALMRNDIAAVKPAALRLHRTAKNSFRLIIADDTGDELSEIATFDLSVGDSMTLNDINRVFELTISPGFT
jgi:hypothetical protein